MKWLVSIVLLWLPLGLHAQIFWPAKTMVETISAPVIRLSYNGDVVDSVSRDAVVRAVDVTERLAAAYEMPTPAVFVIKQPGAAPNASKLAARMKARRTLRSLGARPSQPKRLLRRSRQGGYASEDSALRSVWRGATAARPS